MSESCVNQGQCLERAARRNWGLLYLTAALNSSLALTIPVFMPLLNACGVSDGQVLYLQAAFIVAVALLQTPTGYCADTIGRRNMLLIGAIIAAVGVGWYAVACSWGDFLAAELMLAAGSACVSGADTALLRASVRKVGGAAQCEAAVGRCAAVRQLSETALLFAGGALAVYGVRVPFYTALGGALLLVLVVTGLREIPNGRARGSAQELWQAMRFCLVQSVRLRWLVLAQALVLSFTLAGFWLIVPLLKEYGFGERHYGEALGLLSLISAGFSLGAARIEARLPLYALTPLLALSFALLWPGVLWLAVLGVLLLRMVIGLARVMFTHRLSEEAPEHLCATVLSVSGMVLNFVQALVLVAGGLLLDRTQSACAVAAVWAVVVGVLGSWLVWCCPFRKSSVPAALMLEEAQAG